MRAQIQAIKQKMFGSGLTSAGKPDITFLAVCLLANALFVRWNAFRTFFFFDMGLLIDGAWRVFCGQKPHVDFLYLAGPGHFYAMAVFFKIFGFGKTAIWTHVAFFGGLAIALVFWVSAGLPRYLRWPVTILTTVSFYWAGAFPWYTHTAHLCGIAAVAVLIRSYSGAGSKRTALVFAFCGAMAVLSFIVKSSVGGVYAVFFASAAFLVSPKRIGWALAGFAAGLGIGTLVCIALFLPSPTAFWDQTILQYAAAQKGRLLNTYYQPQLWFVNGYWVYVLSAFAVSLGRYKTLRMYLGLLCGLWFTAVFTTFTSGANYKVDVQLLGLIAAVTFLIGSKVRCLEGECQLKRPVRTWRLIWTAIPLGVTIFLIPLHVNYDLHLKWFSRPYMSPIVDPNYNPVGDSSFRVGPLKGWKCAGAMSSQVDRLAEYIVKNVPPKSSLLILTDLQVLYAVTGRESFRGVPLCWIDGQWPAPGSLTEITRSNILKNPPEWIVTHTGRIAFGTNMAIHLRLQKVLKENYKPAFRTENYMVLSRVTRGPIADPFPFPGKVGELPEVVMRHSLKVDGMYLIPRDNPMTLTMLIGAHNYPVGLERQVGQMKVGETREIILEPEEAFGRFREDKIERVAISSFLAKRKGPVELGASIQATGPDGAIVIGKIIRLEEGFVWLNWNHPLAGKRLTYEVEVLEIR